MTRPSNTGGKTSEAKARNATPAKARKISKAKRCSGSDRSIELKEAREQQAATAEILKVIASSPSDVQPVFEAIVEIAKRLLGGFSAAVFRFCDDIADLQAITATDPAADEIMKNSFPRPVTDFQSFAMAHSGNIGQVSETEALSNDIR